jgi:hypothetical protein
MGPPGIAFAQKQNCRVPKKLQLAWHKVFLVVGFDLKFVLNAKALFAMLLF